MSLFLKKLVLRDILFSEQERCGRQGIQEEKKRMKSRLATYMNLWGSTFLAVVLVAAAGAQSAPAVSSAEARKAIEAGYAEWAKARVALDMKTIERMLAPDFYVQSPDRKRTRQEFIDSMPFVKITRFDASVLTVEPRGNDWSVLTTEKVEVDTKDKDGKTGKQYRVLVSRDAWRKVNDNQWTLLSTEPLGQERREESPLTK
jgi:ketosteroid isomerase-like protein